jgi:hypothetical protein
MAILHYKPDGYNPIPMHDDIVNIKECAIIGGKLLTGTLTFNESKLLSPDEIKSQLAKILADAMIQNNLIEFTKRYDSLNCQNIINARCYLAPNDQVKIIRELKNG